MSVVVAQLTKVKVVIEGIAPGVMFQGKGVMEADANGKKPKKRSQEEEARLRAHWMGRGKNKQLCIPWVMFQKSFCQAANAFDWVMPDGKKQKVKLGYIIGSTLTCEVDFISLGTDQFETWVEWVRIPPKTGAMVQIGRPLIRKWKVEMILVIDDEMWNVAILEEIIAHAGKVVGIGAQRPGLKGPYGKFVVLSFEVME